jgi:deoxyribonuclease IV
VLIGVHVSNAGGLPLAVQRGVELGCEAIQIFNQSPRMWRPTAYTDEDFAAFREAMAASDLQAVVIHAVYLINCATDDPELRAKSLASLTHSLRVGDAIGAGGVVLHAGSAKSRPLPDAIADAGAVIAEALAETDSCPLHLEDTAGAGGTLGRSFDELHALIAAAGGTPRLGLCLDSCHLLASGYDIRTAAGLEAVLEEADAAVGLDRLGTLHVNDSQAPLGSNRDRHAALGDGELGDEGCAAFFSEPRFEGLPAIFEGPGADGKAPTTTDVRRAYKLREQGLAARGI